MIDFLGGLLAMVLIVGIIFFLIYKGTNKVVDMYEDNYMDGEK